MPRKTTVPKPPKAAKPKPVKKPADESMALANAAGDLAHRWGGPGGEAGIMAIRALLLEIRALRVDLKNHNCAPLTPRV